MNEPPTQSAARPLRRRRLWRSLALQTLLFLVIGLALSLLVAWRQAYIAQGHGFGPESAAAPAYVFAPGPDGTPIYYQHALLAWPGVHHHQLTHITWVEEFRSRSAIDAFDPPSLRPWLTDLHRAVAATLPSVAWPEIEEEDCYTIVTAGWPMHAFACRATSTFIGNVPRGDKTWPWPYPAVRTVVSGGIALPRSQTIDAAAASVPPGTAPDLAIALPFMPLWPGSLINTLFFAAAAYLALVPTLTLRRTLRTRSRRRRGACLACGYNRAGLAASQPCPECGGLAASP